MGRTEALYSPGGVTGGGPGRVAGFHRPIRGQRPGGISAPPVCCETARSGDVLIGNEGIICHASTTTTRMQNYW
jgi:hypothetical protein